MIQGPIENRNETRLILGHNGGQEFQEGVVNRKWDLPRPHDAFRRCLVYAGIHGACLLWLWQLEENVIFSNSDRSELVDIAFDVVF
jgi:hypothetical protein